MARKPQVVLDTMALVSAFLMWTGVAAKVLDRRVSDCVPVLPHDILAEMIHKLFTKKKIHEGVSWRRWRCREYAEYLVALAGMLVRDPEDDMTIACATTVTRISSAHATNICLTGIGTSREVLTELSGC